MQKENFGKSFKQTNSKKDIKFTIKEKKFTIFQGFGSHMVALCDLSDVMQLSNQMGAFMIKFQ